jgi:hypothetical protein
MATVLKLLTAPGGALTLQNAKLNTQNVTVVRLLTAITDLTADVKRLGTATDTLTNARTPPDSLANASLPKKQCTASARAPERHGMQLE